MLLLFFSIKIHAQNFTLNIIPTAVTCQDQGALAFSVDNGMPGSPITYSIYILPDIANPILQTTENVVNGLDAANYYVTATQVSDAGTLNAIAQATIEDNSQLAFTINNISELCGTTGEFFIDVTSGVAAYYEIVYGPSEILPPQQSSPYFSDVEVGWYGIKVTDICGNEVTNYATIYTGGVPTVESAVITRPALFPGCGEVEVNFDVSFGQEGGPSLNYPLTAIFTVHHQDGSTTVITQEIESGNPWNQNITQILPSPGAGETLFFDLEVDYGCGIAIPHVWGAPPGQLPLHISLPSILGEFGEAGCGNKYLVVKNEYLAPPYTIEMITYPENFNPEEYNLQYPGPYTESTVLFGNADMPVPPGFYEALVTDNCGMSKSVVFTVTATSDINYHAYNYDCVNNLGWIDANLIATEGITEDINLTHAVINDGPEEYEHDYPYDVSQFINDDHILHVTDLPPGTYWLRFEDQCGNTLIKSIQVRDFVPSGMLGDSLPDCEPDYGTVKMYTSNPPLIQAFITRAPDDFPFALPYDASFNINEEGIFYMDGLPVGEYAIQGVDNCSVADEPRYYFANVTTYQITEDNLEIIPGCNTFEIVFDYQSNAPGEELWLQKQYDNGQWGHPVTGEFYTEGTIPNTDNAMILQNHNTITGDGWDGNYRILRHHRAYTPITAYKDCLEEVHNFTLHKDLQVLKANSLSCPGQPVDLELVTTGVEPVVYTITNKNGIPYLVQNGNNNIFEGLEPAIYTITIEDSCNRSITLDINIDEVTPLIVANNPGTMVLCDEGNDGMEVFDLTAQDAAILGSQDADDYTITYYASQEDAEAATNTLPYQYSSGPATVYARVIHNATEGCYETVAFSLQLLQTPELAMQSPVPLCEGETITLTAPPGFASYLWSNNVAEQQITISSPGLYNITVTNDNGCENTQSIEVITPDIPKIQNVVIEDWTDFNNVITVNTEPYEGYLQPEYSIDGTNFQQNNVFEGLKPGRYLVTVRDAFGCGEDTKVVYLLMYPKFFTPNGDNVHDTWYVSYSSSEPGMVTRIFDRYGQLLYVMQASDYGDDGWDGTLNGKPLPATDYWFVITRDDGTEYKGHFALVR